jgi:hypothetical protein
MLDPNGASLELPLLRLPVAVVAVMVMVAVVRRAPGRAVVDVDRGRAVVDGRGRCDDDGRRVDRHARDGGRGVSAGRIALGGHDDAVAHTGLLECDQLAGAEV